MELSYAYIELASMCEKLSSEFANVRCKAAVYNVALETNKNHQILHAASIRS